MIRVQATREQTVATRYRVECEKNRVSREMIHFLFYFRKLGFLSLGGDFSCDATAGDFLDLIDVGLSPRRSQVSIDYFDGLIESIWARKRSRLMKIDLGVLM